MQSKLREYEKTIKKKHRINWTPSYQDTTYTKLKVGGFEPVVIKVFEIPSSYSCAHPWAVVIEPLDSVVSDLAVGYSRWPEYKSCASKFYLVVI